ncbi:MAG: hypothetical protein EOP35_07970 [Rubrivivax sp.]|nr:MAG: hypothetical protein EOP35_07970 [Rubrivivax sp.]
MKLSPSLIALALSAVALPAFADEPAPDPLSFNVGVVSDYRYRGISQTRLKPALQGGIDYAAPNGFYVGTWASTIKWIKDVGGDSQVEIDVYGGWKGEVSPGLTLDVGGLQYYYASNKLNPSANTFELYGALSFGPVTVKYSHALTDTFANPDSKSSGYLDVAASFEIMDGWMLAPHLGHQKIKGPVGPAASYTDYSLTLSKTFGSLTPSIAVLGTDADKGFYTVKDKFLGKSGVVVGLKYAF